MLKILLLIGLIALVLFLAFVLVMAGVAVLMIYVILTTRDAPGKDEAVGRDAADVGPPHDDALFNRLVREAMAYATRPFVTTIVDASGIVLLSTVSDAYGRRVYAESRRRDGKTLNAIICVYENGSHVPVAKAASEIPATRADWPAYFEAMKDVQANGPLMTFIDDAGRRRQFRIPRRRSHHA